MSGKGRNLHETVISVASQPPTPRKPEKRSAAEKKRRWRTGAGEGIRTLDFNLGKVALYP